MLELFDTILKFVDQKWLLENTEKLWKKEFGQCFKNYREAARFTEKLMIESNIKNVERITFPADGKTTYQDKTMPLAWDATCGKLTVLKSSLAFEDPVVADFKRHPFHLIKGSVSTPSEGIITRLITEEQLFGGYDAKNAMVITNSNTSPRKEIYSAACDFGALGIVNDNLVGRYETPDAIQWVTACTEGSQWHILDDDRPLIGFSVSPRIAENLRNAARAGEVIVRVLSDGRRYEGEIDVVTGVIHGKEEREVWIIAHLYEPLSSDNSSGVVSGIEIARILQKMIKAGKIPKPRFTLRLVFAMEMYGFAAYAHYRGGYLRDKVIGAINLDGLPITKDCRSARVIVSPNGSPFFGDYISEHIYESYKGQELPLLSKFQEQGDYGDDMFLSDSTTGVATKWIIGVGKKLWHNSAQDMSIIDREKFTRTIALSATWIFKILLLDTDNIEAVIYQAFYYAEKHILKEANQICEEFGRDAQISKEDRLKKASLRMYLRYTREHRRFSDFKRVYDNDIVDKNLGILKQEKERIYENLIKQIEELTKSSSQDTPKHKTDKWLEYADTMIPRRATVGFPYDLRKIPKSERKNIPESCIYGPFSRILANMDGKKTLKELLLEAEWESGIEFAPARRKKYIGTVNYLSKYRYLDTKYRDIITKDNIAKALEKTGLKRGNLVMLHSGLSHFGYINGGADTVIDAFLDVLGKEGTLLMPTFTKSFIYFNDNIHCANKNYRPFRLNKYYGLVGNIPKKFLERKGVLRSKHPTHSVAGIGPLAEQCLMEHIESDPPTCRKSPFGKLVEYKGKMVWFGADLNSTTFFHFLEDEMDMPYLQKAVCRIENEDENIRSVLVPKHLPGHRDFYEKPAEKSKMYRRLMADGLVINKIGLGLGGIKVIGANYMYELGMHALKDDPNILLCDNLECKFCVEAKEKIRKGEGKCKNLKLG